MSFPCMFTKAVIAVLVVSKTMSRAIAQTMVECCYILGGTVLGYGTLHAFGKLVDRIGCKGISPSKDGILFSQLLQITTVTLDSMI